MDTMKFQVSCSVEGTDFEVHFPDYDAAFQFYQAFQKATDNHKRCEIKQWVPGRGYFNAARLNNDRPTKTDVLRRLSEEAGFTVTDLHTNETLKPNDLLGVPREENQCDT
jgi:hypothetical protein